MLKKCHFLCSWETVSKKFSSFCSWDNYAHHYYLPRLCVLQCRCVLSFLQACVTVGPVWATWTAASSVPAPSTSEASSARTTAQRVSLSSSSLIYLLTVRVVGAPQMISQPVSSFFPCSPQTSGTWPTPGRSILWCCLANSSSVCLVFFPLSLCLAR